MIASALGGWSNELWGWRTAFLIAGIPGILVALLVALTVKEPPRGMSDGVPLAKGTRIGSFAAVAYLWKRPAFRNMALAAALHAFVWYGAANFNSVFLVETHRRGTGEIGTWMSGMFLIGAAGTFFGGFLSDRLSTRRGDERYYMLVPGIATVLGIPFQILGYLAPSFHVALIGFAGSASSPPSSSARRSRWRRASAPPAAARSPHRCCCSSRPSSASASGRCSRG